MQEQEDHKWKQAASNEMRLLMATHNVKTVAQLHKLLSDHGIEQVSVNAIVRKIREGTFGHDWYLKVKDALEKASTK